MRRLFGSVRARATLAATLVVAVALVAAGAAVLLSLRSNLIDQAGTQAERAARNVAADLSGGTPYTGLELDDDDEPVQVVDEHDTLVAATEHLERISGTGTAEVKPQPPAAGTGARARPATRRTPTTTRQGTRSPSSNPARSPTASG